MTFDEWWEQQIDVPIHKSPILTKTHKEIAKEAWEAGMQEGISAVFGRVPPSTGCPDSSCTTQ